LGYILALWGFFMMPGFMTFAMLMSIVGGILGGVLDAKKQNRKNKNRRPNMTLDADAWNF
jgi:hypothetical protein